MNAMTPPEANREDLLCKQREIAAAVQVVDSLLQEVGQFLDDELQRRNTEGQS